MNGAVIEARVAEPCDVRGRDGGGLKGQTVRVQEQRALARTQVQIIERAVLEPAHQCLLRVRRNTCGGQEPTETRSVVVYSVAARVERGNTYCEHFAFAPRDGPAAMHDLAIQLEMLAHHWRVDGVDLDDVIGIIHPFVRAERIGRDVRDECHEEPAWSTDGPADE